MHFLRAWLKICDFEYGNHHSGTELNLDEHDNFRLIVMSNKSWTSSTVYTGASVFCSFRPLTTHELNFWYTLVVNYVPLQAANCFPAFFPQKNDIITLCAQKLMMSPHCLHTKSKGITSGHVTSGHVTSLKSRDFWSGDFRAHDFRWNKIGNQFAACRST